MRKKKTPEELAREAEAEEEDEFTSKYSIYIPSMMREYVNGNRSNFTKKLFSLKIYWFRGRKRTFGV